MRPDASIPVLTEVIELHEDAARERAGPLADISTELPDIALATTEPQQPLPIFDEAAMLALEERVREHVLRSLTPRVEELIESRLRGRMNDLVDHMLTAMSGQIKESVRETLRDAVARAVSDELLTVLLDRSESGPKR
jgi:hypothetical protein